MKKNNFVRYDGLRGLGHGVLETGFGVFILLIAIRFWEAPSFYKGALSGGGSLGLILTPIILGFFSRNPFSDSKKCAFFMIATAAFIFFASFVSSLILFTVLLVLAQICLSQVPSLMIRVYSEVYQNNERGRKLAFNLIFSTLGGLISSYFFGTYLDASDASFQVVLWGMSIAALLSAASLMRMKVPLSIASDTHEQTSLRNIIRVPLDDRLFLRILIAWMILGFGAIMTFPLRVEYLSRENQLNLSNQEIAIVTVMIFFGAKTISMTIWGKLFDRMHFMKFRILLNLFMTVAIIIYFNSNTLPGVMCGSALAGAGMGGASLAWTLWVTKLAPRGREKDYMSIHMALTGLRGATAPFAGYFLEEFIGFDGVSLVSTCLIICASLVFATTLKHPRLKI